MIPYGTQSISEADVEAVADVLRSDFLTQGPVVPNFERAIASRVGARHGVAVSSATAALHVACIALGLGPGDRLWTSPISFVASANCGVYCGADIDFVDIDPGTFNMCPQKLEEKLIDAEKKGVLPKVVVPVHMCGQSPNMVKIAELAKRYDFRLIEDASHAIGATFNDASVGSCSYSDVTVFSFHPVKIITTGEGGLALTNDEQIAERMRILRTHGITRDTSLMEGGSHGPWYYQQIELGFNYRMTDIQAALGLSQLSRLEEFLAARRRFANRYDTLLNAFDVALPERLPGSKSSWHLYVVRLFNAGEQRNVFDSLRHKGIGVNLHYIPIHLQPFYRKRGFSVGDFPESESYYSRAISIPIFPAMTDLQQQAVISALAKALNQEALLPVANDCLTIHQSEN